MKVSPYKACPACDGKLEVIYYSKVEKEEERHDCNGCELRWNQTVNHYYFERRNDSIYHINKAEMVNENCFDEWRVMDVRFKIYGFKVEICYNYMEWEYGTRIMDMSVGPFGKEIVRMKTFIPDYKNLEPLKTKLKIYSTFS